MLGTLDYINVAPTTDSPTKLVLREDAGGTELVWPVVSARMGWFGIVSQLLSVAVYAAQLAMVGYFVRTFPMPLNARMVAWIIVPQITLVAIYAVGAFIAIKSLQCARQIPRVLRVDSAGITKRFPTWRGQREHRWPLDRIRHVDWKPSKNDLLRRPMAIFRIRIKGKWFPIAHRFIGPEKLAAGQRFYEVLRAAQDATHDSSP